MILRKGFLLLFLSIFIFPLFSQEGEQGLHQYVIRGEVYVDLEPIYAGHIDSEYPLDAQAAGRRALEEAALFFSAMIYGWSFNYEVGERARQIEEVLDLELLGKIETDDPALRVTDTKMINYRLHVWTDYHLNDVMRNRMEVWRKGRIRNAQAIGYSPSFIKEYPGWLEYKKLALEDAARIALRAMLRGSERNRPKEVKGFISLASFPRYFIQSGRWAASARFRVQVVEIIPFGAH